MGRARTPDRDHVHVHEPQGGLQNGEVREADALTPAEGDLQPRDRQSCIQARDQQNDIYANFDPERLHASPEADRGAPIVAPVKEDPMNTIEAGNNRVEVLKRIHAGDTPEDQSRAQAYRDTIKRVTGQDDVLPHGRCRSWCGDVSHP